MAIALSLSTHTYIYKDNFKRDYNWEKKLIATTHFTSKMSEKENESFWISEAMPKIWITS